MKKIFREIFKRVIPFRIVRIENMSLTKQLVLTTLVALALSAISLCVILPAILKPYYEENIYSHLEQPSKFIKPETNKMGEDIAFIIIMRSGAIYTSDNLDNMIPHATTGEIIDLANEKRGHFVYDKNTYYYLWGLGDGAHNLILTNSSQITKQSNSLLGIIFPTMLATIAITILLLVAWSQYILKKVKKLKKKAESLITGEKVDEREFLVEDELSEVNRTINEVDKELKEKEEYKNLMFQNLSHELKTPISVIQNYIEGIQDGVVKQEEAIRVIAEETNSLSNQVKTILQINKIDYMKDSKKYTNSKVDLKLIINEVVQKHKLIRTDIEFKTDFADEEIIFRGTADMWKSVFDNILGNFVRYANSKVDITIKHETIFLFNDGEKIDEGILDKIFLPYIKGKKGQSGLGLSIAKKTVNIFGYDIKAENTNEGVLFIIK